MSAWYAGDVTQDDFILIPSPHKARVSQSKHGRPTRNWIVRSEFWQIRLTYATWSAAMEAARDLADTGKVSTFHLLGAEHLDNPRNSF